MTTPAYRRRSGTHYAQVSLTDSQTVARKNYYLGRWGSPESKERYYALLAEWEAGGRRLPESSPRTKGTAIAALLAAYLQDMSTKYSASYLGELRMDARIIVRHAGRLDADEFGPNELRSIRHTTTYPDTGRRAWTRQGANRFGRRVIAIWKWGVSRGLVRAETYAALNTLEPLRMGVGVDAEQVVPVDEATIEATLAELSPPLSAMVRLQLLTGMRPGEVVQMRACDLDTRAQPWSYRPQHHKTGHLGKSKTIYFGPRGQEIVSGFLSEAGVGFLFCYLGETPSRTKPIDWRIMERHPYSVASYRRAVERACDRANIAAGGSTSLRAIPRWTPHQLRHTYATRVRAEYGAEQARAALGHAHLRTTEIYAEIDSASVKRMALRIG